MKAGKVRFWARLGHLIYKAKHLTGEDVEREWGEVKGVSWRWLKLCVGDKSGKKRMRWWNDDVEAAVRRKKRAYKRWIEVQTSESRDEYFMQRGR